MSDAFEVVENFFPGAEGLRASVDAHFSDPFQHKPHTHQVWNYWHVPEHYTYLRTDPLRVLGRELAQGFHDHLKAEVFERWGLSEVTWPYLSCYVAGCFQALHNDARGGRLGYVFSLTRWNERKFSGGETLVFREQDYFGTSAMTEAAAARNFYELVPALFNRLVVFDDRVPHAVPRLEGGMNPIEGRIVMHGHLAEGPPEVEGPLAVEAMTAVVDDIVAGYVGKVIALAAGRYHGLFVARVQVGPDGRVSAGRVLLDRVMPVGPAASRSPFAAQKALEILMETRFPEADESSRITVPIPITPY